MRNALTIALGLVLLVSTAFFAESGPKHAEEERLGREFQQVVVAKEAPAGDARWEAPRRGRSR